MSNASKFIDGKIEDKLLNLHTAYIGKVISVKNNKATIQPLHKTKEKGCLAEKYPIIEDVPICSYPMEIMQPSTNGHEKTVIEGKLKIESGNVVLCIACERSIDDGLSGNVYTPLTKKRHSMNDSVIVAKIGG